MLEKTEKQKEAGNGPFYLKNSSRNQQDEVGFGVREKVRIGYY